MSDSIGYQAGDIIMKRGQAYKITEIVIREINEEEQHFLNYEPCFDVGRFKGMKCSIAVNNLDRVNVRKPVSQKKAEKVLLILTQEPEVDEKVNVRVAESLTHSNAISQVAELAAALRLEQADPEASFSHSKKELLAAVIMRLAQEFAVVYDTTLEEAEALIYTHLDRLATLQE